MTNLTKDDVTNAISFGFKKTKENFFTFLDAILVVAIIYVLIECVNYGLLLGEKLYLKNSLDLIIVSSGFGIILFIINYVIQALVILGFYRMGLKIYDNLNTSYKDLFTDKLRIITYLLSTILLTLILFVPFLLILAIIILGKSQAGSILTVIFTLLILPIIFYVQIKFAFFPYFIVDQKTNSWKSLKNSFAITKNSFWNLFGFFIFCAVINLVGFLLLLVGLLFTIPATILATTFVYRTLLQKQTSNGQSQTPPPVAPPAPEIPLVVNA